LNGVVFSCIVTLVLDDTEWLALTSGHFTPRETILGRQWMGLKGTLDVVTNRKTQCGCGNKYTYNTDLYISTGNL